MGQPHFHIIETVSLLKHFFSSFILSCFVNPVNRLFSSNKGSFSHSSMHGTGIAFSKH